MCGIIGSFDKKVLLDLANINLSRGTKAYSVTSIDPVTCEIRHLDKYDSLFNMKVLNQYKFGENYFIIHLQSPTAITKDIHPSEYNNSYFYHNGMLLDNCLSNLKTTLNKESNWDTGLIHEYIYNDFRKLDDLEGSFACLFLKNNKLYAFKNQISPLFIDKHLNISSVSFKEMTPLEHNKIYILDLVNKTFSVESEFYNKHNPYDI